MKKIALSEMMKTFDEHDWIECKTKMEKSTGDKHIKKMTLDESIIRKEAVKIYHPH